MAGEKEEVRLFGKSRTSESRTSENRSAAKKLTWNEQRELEQLEARIAAAESEQSKLQTALNRGDEDYTRIQALADQLQTVEKSLEDAFERWAELAERME